MREPEKRETKIEGSSRETKEKRTRGYKKRERNKERHSERQGHRKKGRKRGERKK